MRSFNLIDEKWIPCMMLDGRKQEMNLHDVIVFAHNIREIFDTSPLVTAALHRLLFAITHRVFESKNLLQWRGLWVQGKFQQERIEDYFNRWHEHFYLFHAERPFYQKATFLANKRTPVKRLGWEFAAGNNATLFDHSLDEDRPDFHPSIVARWVVATQSFAASAGKSETIHTKDSPWTRGAIILMQGNNLFETLALNLLNLLKPDFASFDDDLPSWESGEDWQPAHNQMPSGILDYLTWQSRSIKLLPTENGSVRECFFAQGRALPDDWRNELMYAYKRDDKQGLIVWQFNGDRAVWRDSHALFNISPNAPFQIPQAPHHLASLHRNGFVEQHRIFQLQVLGQCLESGQPTIHFWRQERLPLHLDYLNEPSLREQLGEAIQVAEGTAQDLQQSLWQLAKLLLATNSNKKDARQPDKKDVKNLVDSFRCLSHYWSQLEPEFRCLLADLPEDRIEESGDMQYGKNVLPQWVHSVKEIAEDSFSIATRSLDNSSRALKAVADSERRLRSKLRDTFKNHLKN
jgi:CRISPR system Cascade subunit CasA